MTSQIRQAGPLWLRALPIATLLAFVPTPHGSLSAASGAAAIQSPNYELASQWTTAKIDKTVFDVNLTPHWLETSDRFWYRYETREGKRYYIVDPQKKTKAALFDNAKLAAMLTAATLVPMDAQHLPIKSLKAIKGDTALRLEVEVPKAAEIPGMKKAPAKPTSTAGDKQEQPDGGEND